MILTITSDVHEEGEIFDMMTAKYEDGVLLEPPRVSVAGIEVEVSSAEKETFLTYLHQNYMSTIELS